MQDSLFKGCSANKLIFKILVNVETFKLNMSVQLRESWELYNLFWAQDIMVYPAPTEPTSKSEF